MVKGIPNAGAIRLISVKHVKKCYTRESVMKKINAMQLNIDFLTGQNQRLKRIEDKYNSWKDIIGSMSKWGLKRILEDYYENRNTKL